MRTKKTIMVMIALVMMCFLVGIPLAFAEAYLFLKGWGERGSGRGQFDGWMKHAVDASGNVYVADFGNNRVQKFDSNGTYITHWVPPGLGKDKQIVYWSGIAVDSLNKVYVTDLHNHLIWKFNSNGIPITNWGRKGKGDGEFTSPISLGIDASNYVYVGDKGNATIQKFRKLDQQLPPKLVAIDPMSIILPERIYLIWLEAKKKFPPPPGPPPLAEMEQFLQFITPEEREEVIRNANTLGDYANTLGDYANVVKEASRNLKKEESTRSLKSLQK